MTRAFSVPYQSLVSRLLNNALESDRLHSAYLFSGSEGYGKWHAAVSFAGEILSAHLDSAEEREKSIRKVDKLIHPDLHYVFPMPSPKNKTEEVELPQFFRESKVDDPFAPVEYGRVANILIEKVKGLKRALSTTPSESEYRVAIFQQVERAPRTSFDILLKTIEEPPPATVLILLTDNLRRLPATVVSRCQKVRFLPVDKRSVETYLIERKGLPEDEASRYASLSGGSFSEAYHLSRSDISERREAAMNFLRVMAKGERSAGFAALSGTVDLRNRDEVLGTVKLMQCLFRDILVLSQDLPKAYLMNSDYETELREVLECYGDCNAICRSMVELFETQKLFYRNVPPRLALTTLSWRLMDLMTAK